MSGIAQRWPLKKALRPHWTNSEAREGTETRLLEEIRRHLHCLWATLRARAILWDTKTQVAIVS